MKQLVMTQQQLFDACKDNKYLALRCFTGQVVAINCKVAKLAAKKNGLYPENETFFMSFRPCSFQEYISNKTPFL